MGSSRLHKTAAQVGIALALLAMPISAVAGQETDDDAKAGDFLISVEDMAEMLGPTVNGVVATTINEDAYHRLMVIERDAPGATEIHENWSDIFIVQSGEADVTIGGDVSGALATAPGEWRGGTITGGHVRHVRTGDILWIPAGMPHLTIPTGDAPFRYLTVKTSHIEDSRP